MALHMHLIRQFAFRRNDQKKSIRIIQWTEHCPGACVSTNCTVIEKLEFIPLSTVISSAISS